ncbi:TasA family protein [Catenibacterium mitsuokai]|uniref:TasA family protein n=1 Tax=Catenibacterium mitsuokai TaxID=100886 RepID=UPI003F897A43
MNITKIMRNKDHRKTLIVLVIVLSLGLFSSVSAYFMDKATAKNSFTIGYVETKIEEDYTPPHELKPGITFTKKVTVKNTGSNDCYVRVLVTFSNSNMEHVCSIDYNNTDWKKNDKDGYWYYKKLLKSGETTEPLFKTVTVSPNVDENNLQDFDINVYHESSNTEFK